MAESRKITIKLENNTDDVFNFESVKLEHGKTVYGPDQNIPAHQEMTKIYKTTGKADTAQGTKGSLKYTGPYGATLVFKWDKPWGSGDTSGSFGCKNPDDNGSACSAYRLKLKWKNKGDKASQMKCTVNPASE